MKKNMLQLALLLALAGGVAHAEDGYWFSSAGEVVTNGSGECWHTGYWAAAMAIVAAGTRAMEPSDVATAPSPMSSLEAGSTAGVRNMLTTTLRYR